MNPGLYRKMSEPFASDDEANGAIQAFFDELYELRKKHRIADVHVTVCVNVGDAETESPRLARMHIGDSLKAEAMTAYAFGREQEAREQVVGEILGRKKKASP